MAKKSIETDIIYRCPFCEMENWYNHKEELAQHLNREHLRLTLYAFSDKMKAKVKKINKKWCVR